MIFAFARSISSAFAWRRVLKRASLSINSATLPLQVLAGDGMSGSSASLLALRLISASSGAARIYRSIVASRADNAARSARLRSYFSWASARSASSASNVEASVSIASLRDLSSANRFFSCAISVVWACFR
ncbi:hypothetical protein [Mesorhizobium sp.]|uniref:hypothetical protein n=1 Tax=Mesorhizobium sp. TaxID=1871066 RepID=UPI0025FDEA1B|nr:hypothetical protein [Mesorhizobium sp.]